MGGCSSKPLTDEQDLKAPLPISEPEEEIEEYGHDDDTDDDADDADDVDVGGKKSKAIDKPNRSRRTLKSLFVEHKIDDQVSIIGIGPTLQQLLQHPLDLKYVKEFKDLSTYQASSTSSESERKAKPDRFSSTGVENPEMVKQTLQRIMYEPERAKLEEIRGENTDMEEVLEQPIVTTGSETTEFANTVVPPCVQVSELNDSRPKSVGEASEFDFDVKPGNVEDVSHLVHDHVKGHGEDISALQVVMMKHDLLEASIQLSDVEDHGQECAEDTAVVDVMKHVEHVEYGNFLNHPPSQIGSTQPSEATETEQKTSDDGAIGTYDDELDQPISDSSILAPDRRILYKPSMYEARESQNVISAVQSQRSDKEYKSLEGKSSVRFDTGQCFPNIQNESHAAGESGYVLNEEPEAETKTDDRIMNEQITNGYRRHFHCSNSSKIVTDYGGVPEVSITEAEIKAGDHDSPSKC